MPYTIGGKFLQLGQSLTYMERAVRFFISFLGILIPDGLGIWRGLWRLWQRKWQSLYDSVAKLDLKLSSSSDNLIIPDRIRQIFTMLATLTFIFGCDIDSYKDYTVREYSANTISSGENDHGTFLRFFEVLGNNPTIVPSSTSG